MRVKVRTATGSHNSAETPASNIAIARCSSASRSVQEMPSIAHLRVEAPRDDRACDVKVLLNAPDLFANLMAAFVPIMPTTEVNWRQTTGPIRDNCAGSRPAARFTQAAL